MKDVDSINFKNSSDDMFPHEESLERKAVLERKNCTGKILEAHYKNADLQKVTADANHLKNKQRAKQLALLHKYGFLFDGTLGTWHMAHGARRY